MDDNETQQPADLQNIQTIGFLLVNINAIIATPIVEVRRQQPVPNHLPAEPYIELTQVGKQHLAIGGHNIAVQVVRHKQVHLFVDLGENNYRIRGQPIAYDINGADRIMAETRYLSEQYLAIFSYGIIGCSGPQAELLVDKNRHYLYVIDPQTAILLRNQCLTQANNQSLVYKSMWSSTLVSKLNQCLYHLSAGNVKDADIMNIRLIIYRLGNRCIEFIHRALRSKQIYRKAVVWVEGMNRLPLVNPAPPLRHIVAPDNQPVPDIVVPNLQQSVARITGFINQVTQHMMFTRNWEQMFNGFANLNTSVPIIGTEEQGNGEEVLEQTVRLTNNQEFLVKVFANDLVENNEWTYSVHSPAFMETFQNRYQVKPVVGEFEPLVVMRRLKPPAVNIPLHSHGLAGSYDANRIQGGNNGFQVTTLNFNGVDGLNHRRLYFVNREMAMELRELFEIIPNNTIPAMSQYHQWFFEMIQMSRLVCDLRQWYRQVVQQDIGGQWLLDIQHCAHQLFLLPRQLFLKYTFISRLEQLWNHSILVPNIRNGEPPIRSLPTTSAMYLGKSSGRKRRTNAELGI